MSGAGKKLEEKVITPGKNIVASMADDFRKELLNIANEGVKNLVIDLNGVETVDSIGIGVLVAAHKSFAKAGGSIRLCNVSDNIFKLFKTLRLDECFEVMPV